jgi:hypothetical protein
LTHKSNPRSTAESKNDTTIFRSNGDSGAAKLGLKKEVLTMLLCEFSILSRQISQNLNERKWNTILNMCVQWYMLHSCDHAVALPLEECCEDMLASTTGDRCLSYGHAPQYDDLENLYPGCARSADAKAMRDEKTMRVEKELLHQEVMAEAEWRE